MTPVTPPGSGALTPTPMPEVSADTLASQNIFEHMTQQAGSSLSGASPSELGSSLLNNLDGFIDRVNNFAQQAKTPGVQTPDRLAQVMPQSVPDAGDTPPALGDDKLAQVVESLGRVFDHSIETTMIVRGATQVSGSANTLLKGQ